ncbi:MAG: hypothetical protein BXU00_01425 [Candidatus Nanoclepta minutus]|uniref:ATPase dynein-related AAA domain-containing protein n=1 Tax=Candidatus Nanoclepta minutus TaxID=1940235 RepID=A0A397WPH8_9ARCH|nr:MAG: hypothetical protein BXU00_01425 [Candidatus Nanoclepta minutus]
MEAEDLFKLFKLAEEEKMAVLLIGKYGTGKSSVVYEYGKKRAKELEGELAIWHELSEEEKEKVIKNAGKYYVIVDIKGPMISPENLIMPLLVDEELIWETPLWVKVFNKEESAGILLIDNIDMAPSGLQSTLSELILQRKIAEDSLESKNLLVAAVGNDSGSNEYANEIPKQLLNRFIVVNTDNILLNVDYWVKWALQNDIDKRVIDYVLYKNNLFTMAREPLGQSTTPRTLHILSDMIKNENNMEYIELVSKASLEEHDALEFTEFIKLYEKLKDLEKYVKNTELLNELNEQELFIVSMKITDMYLNNKVDVDKYFNFIESVAKKRREYSLTMYKYIKDIVKNSEKTNMLIEKILQHKDSEMHKLFNELLTFSKL